MVRRLKLLRKPSSEGATISIGALCAELACAKPSKTFAEKENVTN
jgi:hypothetical protein